MKLRFNYGIEIKELLFKSKAKKLDKDFKIKKFDLEKFLSKLNFKGKKIGFILPDTTRPLPSKEILEKIYPEISNKDVSIFIGTGTHRQPTKEELKGYLGRFYDKFPVIINDSKNEKIYKNIGKTKYGTDVEILSQLFEQDEIIGLTVVRPHYYAGFSGGRKIFIPGVSSYKTIQQNHKFVLDPNPEKGKNPYAVLGSLDKNPVHLDMMEVLKLIPVPFKLLNFVIYNKKIIYAAEEFSKAVNFVRDNFEIRTKEKFDTLIISAGGYPFDSNFIQGHKALEHSIGALKEGGKIYAFIEAKEGFGSQDCIEFLRIGSIEGITKKLREDFRVYGHTALTILMKARKYDINLHTNLSDDDLKMMGFKRWDGETIPKSHGRTGILEHASFFYFQQ